MMQQAGPAVLPTDSTEEANYLWMPKKGVVDLETRRRIAAAVKAAMVKLEIPTKAALAERIGVHRSTIGRLLDAKIARIGLDLFIRVHRRVPISADLMLDLGNPRKGQNPGPNGQQPSPPRP